MKKLMRLLREPLFHFLVIGGLLFGLYMAVSGPTPTPANKIVIGPDRIAQLAAGYEAVWQRPPNNDELRGLLDGFVREEVFYREALALGLDVDDAIIRRRLQQKMEFLTDSGADLIEPAEGELEAYFNANKDKYKDAPQIAFQQIFLGESPTLERQTEILTALKNDAATDPHMFGERTLLSPQMALSPPGVIDSVFGAGFFSALAPLPTSEWTGPVKSGYGSHFVRLESNIPGRVPPFDEARDTVVHEWKSDKAKEVREQFYARLLERYDVVVSDSAEPDNP